jgi:hypothetical protein
MWRNRNRQGHSTCERAAANGPASQKNFEQICASSATFIDVRDGVSDGVRALKSISIC